MKKKRILLSLFLILSIFCFAACKKDTDTTTPPATLPPAQTTPTEPTGPVDPTLNVGISSGKHYVGDLLSSVGIFLTVGDSAGTVAWDNPTYVLVLGENLCSWTFTPDDANAFNTKSGTKTIIAVNRAVVPEIEVSVEEGTFYEGEKLSAVTLSYTPSTIEGTVAWTNPNTELVVGTHEYEWTFTPDDTDAYEVVIGTAEVEVSAQYLTSIEIKTTPTQMTGYTAFETLDQTGLTLNLIYNKGKTETINSGWEISYSTGESLVAGNNLVTITYQEKTCTLEINDVAKIEVAEPTFESKTYTGSPLTTTIVTTESQYFTYDASQTFVNAGTHLIDIALIDSNNYEWETEENKSKTTIQVPFVINKVALVVTKNDYNAPYDGEEHSATVEADGAETIYYATTILNIENYSSVGSTTPIKYTNVIADVIIYYYIVGDINHFDASGSLTLNITKQQARFASNYCYAVATGDVIEYPEEYIQLVDNNGTSIELTATPTITYYVDYVNKIKTTVFNNGSNYVGGAPAEPSDGTPYAVLIEYSDDNYNASTVVYLYIEYQDNMFYSSESEAEFAFKYKPGEYGSTELCTYYAEFYLQENAALGITELACNFKMGAGTNNNKTGIIVYQDGGYKLIDSDGNETAVVASEEESTITITNGNILLEKWVIPDYLGTYSGQTIRDNDVPEEGGEYANKFTSIRLYNDYGTIRFELNYNLVELSLTLTGPTYGGSGSMKGVVEYKGIVANSGTKHKLSCYYTNSEYKNSNDVYFNIYWYAYAMVDGEEVLAKDPQEIIFEEGSLMESDLSLETLVNNDCLIFSSVTYTKQTDE